MVKPLKNSIVGCGLWVLVYCPVIDDISNPIYVTLPPLHSAWECFLHLLCQCHSLAPATDGWMSGPATWQPVPVSHETFQVFYPPWA